MGRSLRPYDLYHRIGKHTDPADRNAVAYTKVQIPTDKGGVNMDGQATVEDYETDHGVRGDIFSEITKRNDQAGTMALPLHPQYAGLLAAPTQTTADGVPPFWTIDTYGFEGLGVAKSGNASADLGERRVVMFTGFSMSVDRNAPTKIGLSLNGFVNTDRRIPAADTTSDTDGTVFGTIAFTLADATGFRVGDHILIEETGGGSNSETVVIESISGNDVTVTTTVALDGSSNSLDVTKVSPEVELPEDGVGVYVGSNTFFDMQFAAAGVFPSAWGGDNRDVTGFDINYDADVAVEDFRANATDDDDHQVWVRAIDGKPTAQGNVTIRLSEDQYADIKRSRLVPKIRYRWMGYHATADRVVTTGGVSAGTNVAIPVADTTGFAIGQIILLDDGTNQAVGRVGSLVVDTSITIERLDADIAIGAQLVNKAYQIKIDTADVSTAPKQAGERYYSVQVAYSAKIRAGNQQIVEVLSYDHAA